MQICPAHYSPVFQQWQITANSEHMQHTLVNELILFPRMYIGTINQPGWALVSISISLTELCPVSTERSQFGWKKEEVSKGVKKLFNMKLDPCAEEAVEVRFMI